MDRCDVYWDSAAWLPPGYILERWCQNDRPCLEAKLQALLTACESGQVNYRRNDGKTYDDPVHELWARRLLRIERASFTAWVMALEGRNPLTAPTPTRVSLPAVPSWATATVPSATTPAEPAAPSPTAGTEPAVTDPEPVSTARVPSTPVRPEGVPSDVIVEAFAVQPDAAANRKWWRDRMRDAPRYQLHGCRVQAGGPNRGGRRRPSLWRPDLVAGWLIDKGHLPSAKAARALRQHFPDWGDAADLLE